MLLAVPDDPDDDDDPEPAQLFIMGELLAVPDACGPLLWLELPVLLVDDPEGELSGRPLFVAAESPVVAVLSCLSRFPVDFVLSLSAPVGDEEALPDVLWLLLLEVLLAAGPPVALLLLILDRLVAAVVVVVALDDDDVGAGISVVVLVDARFSSSFSMASGTAAEYESALV